MPNKDIIVWMKASDPYKTVNENDLEEEHVEGFSQGILPPIEDDGHFDLEGERDLPEGNSPKSTSAIFTPLGVIILDENTDTYKLFNFWIGHTNFDLTKGIRAIIARIPGVEVLHVFTRYRMRVAIAKCFKANKVCSEIKKAIDKYLAEKRDNESERTTGADNT